MGRKIAKHPIERRVLNRDHAVLFHHEVDDFLPTLTGQALLGNEAFRVADDATRIGLCRTFSSDEDTQVSECRLACRNDSRLFRIFAGSHVNRNNENSKRGGKKAPDSPAHPRSVGPSRNALRLLRLHQLAMPAHDTRSATRCMVLLRYPLGFQSMACGCMTPALSVARAQTS